MLVCYVLYMKNFKCTQACFQKLVRNRAMTSTKKNRKLLHKLRKTVCAASCEQNQKAKREIEIDINIVYNSKPLNAHTLKQKYPKIKDSKIN